MNNREEETSEKSLFDQGYRGHTDPRYGPLGQGSDYYKQNLMNNREIPSSVANDSSVFTPETTFRNQRNI